MSQAPSVPSATALWARVVTIVQQAGPAYAQSMQRSQIQAPVALAAFASGRLGDQAPRQPLVEALARQAVLWEPDDGSKAWRQALRTFLAEVRQILEQAGPAVVEGLGGGNPAFHGKGDMAANVAAMEQAVRGADNRFKRLLAKIRQHPDQVSQSVLKHLGTDAVVWHNSLNYLAGKAPSGMAPLLRLAAEVLRQGKAPELFGGHELARIARASMGVWLTGAHRDKEQLRMRVAVVLGEMLDDPQRRGHAVAVLEGMALPRDAAIPPAGDDYASAMAAREALLPAMEQWARNMVGQGDLCPPVEREMAQAVLEGRAEALLDRRDWVAAGRLVGDDPTAGAQELLQRLTGALIDSVDAQALAVEGAGAEAGAQGPGPGAHKVLRP